MANYPIPPWLQPADPASAYAQGLQIGTRIGSEQTRQATEQAAIDRQTQMQAVEEARKQAEFGLKQQAAARRYAAQAKYQDLLSQGVDPAKALLQVAPDLGESLTGAAQLYKSSQPQQMTPYQQAQIEATNAKRNEPRLFHNSDGTVTRVNADGSVETLGTPKAASTKPTEIEKADIEQVKSKLKKATNDLEAVNIGDPEVYNNPTKLHEWQQMENTVELLRQKLSNLQKGSGIKVLSIRKKSSESTPIDSESDTEQSSNDTGE